VGLRWVPPAAVDGEGVSACRRASFAGMRPRRVGLAGFACGGPFRGVPPAASCPGGTRPRRFAPEVFASEGALRGVPPGAVVFGGCLPAASCSREVAPAAVRSAGSGWGRVAFAGFLPAAAAPRGRPARCAAGDFARGQLLREDAPCGGALAKGSAGSGVLPQEFACGGLRGRRRRPRKTLSGKRLPRALGAPVRVSLAAVCCRRDSPAAGCSARMPRAGGGWKTLSGKRLPRVMDVLVTVRWTEGRGTRGPVHGQCTAVRPV
jgi:hypothetical protein